MAIFTRSAVWLVLVSVLTLGCGDSSRGTGGPVIPPAPLAAVITANPTEGDAPLTVNASASNSTGPIVLYEWDYDYDGVTFDIDHTGVSATVNYAAFGQYILALRVTDADSAFDIATVTISVNTAGNTMPSASITAAPVSGNAPLLVTLDASASFDSDGSITAYLWDFEYTGIFREDARTLAPTATIQHTYYFPGAFTAAVKVLDDAGGWDTATTTVTVTDTAITFADPKLEAAVRDAINKPSGPIYGADVVNLKTLDASAMTISSLGGLSRCHNIFNLNLGTNTIANISELATMTCLEWLYLYDNTVSDITPLQNLTKLKGLSLRSNTVSDLTPLASCTMLTDLNVASNSLTDITSLQTCTSLAWLDISGNSISDISPIANLSKIRRIAANGNSITDISSMSGKFPDLEEFELSANGITNIAALAGHPKLAILDLSLNTITDITALQNLTAMTDLNLAGNILASTTPLANLTSITYLNLTACGITSLADLALMTNLRGLYIPLNNVTDLTPLAGAIHLRVLIANNNSALADLSPLANKLELSWLELANDAVVDITALVTNCDAGGLGAGDIVDLQSDPLSVQATTIDIPHLEAAGVTVLH
jgi:Leucine-rich repeat (LRR) protein